MLAMICAVAKCLQFASRLGTKIVFIFLYEIYTELHSFCRDFLNVSHQVCYY